MVLSGEHSWHAVPLHQVSEQVHYLLLQGGPVLDDGVAFVGHLLLKFLQLLDLLADLQLGLGQGRDPVEDVGPGSS